MLQKAAAVIPVVLEKLKDKFILMKVLLTSFVLLGILLLMPACKNKATEGPLTPLKAVGSLNGSPDFLDTAEVKTSSQWHTLLNLGVTLVTHDSKGRLIGSAASSWTASPDFREFTFKLRTGIKDSTGKELDSSDWRASIEHLLDSGGSTHSFISKFLDHDGLGTPDAHTLVFKLKSPYKTFLQRLTTPEFILLPKRAFQKGKRPDFSVTSGAYFVENLSKECVLKANHYSNEFSLDQPETVVIVPLAKTNKEAFSKLSANEWQFYLATVLPTDPDYKDLQKQLKEEKVLSKTVEPSSIALVILMNSKRMNLESQRITIAKFLGEKAEKELDSLSSHPTHQIYPPGFVGALTTKSEAKLFQELKTEKTDLKAIPKRMIGYEAATSVVTGVAGWVAAKLHEAGVTVETNRATANNYIGRQQKIDHDYLVFTTGLNSKDPAGSLLYLISPKDGLIPDPDGSLNQLLQKAVQAESSQMVELLHEISVKLVRTGRVVPLMHYGTMILTSPNVIAEPPSEFDDELRLSDIRWKK